MSETVIHDSEGHRKEAEKSHLEERRETFPVLDWPWQAQALFALFIILIVMVLLVGLPAANMLIVERITSGSGNVSLLGTVSFWGASFAALISLVVLFIGAVFAFTAIKVESGAKWEARKAAEKGVKQIQKKVAYAGSGRTMHT